MSQISWKKINNCDRYLISNTGLIKSVTGKILKPAISDRGYYKYPIKNNQGIVKTMRIHRLVADAFLQKIYGKTEVNHIDGNKLNNNYTNLEYCNRSENIKHYFNDNVKDGKVVLDLRTGIFYNSSSEASKLLKIPKSTLNCMLTGYRKNKTSLIYC
jgi:hypothetical protein